MMKPASMSHLLGRTASVAALLILTLGCSLHRARKAFDEGRYDEAVKGYRDIIQNSPNNVSAKMGYRRAATRAAEAHLDKAREAQKRGLDDQVYLEVRKAAVLDPANAVAADWLANLETAAQRKKLQQDADESIEAQRDRANSRPAVMLNPRSLEGMDLNFAARTSLKQIFGNLSLASGVNIILHTSYQDVQVSADLRGLGFQRILDTLMLQNDLFYKVLDVNTIMVFKASPQNREQYENQNIMTFYLSNAEPNDVRSIFQQLMPQLKVFTDKRLNAVTIKAKPQELAIARRIVSQLDKAKAEVMIYLELMEVTKSAQEQVGLLPVLTGLEPAGSGIYRLGATIDNSGRANQNTGGIRISKSDVRFLFPSLALDAMKSSGDAKLVASPNIRVISGEKGEINIGEKVSTTQSSIGLGGTTGTTTSSIPSSYLTGATQTQYSYEDVGVKITVEPRVHFNGDITMKIKSEVKTKLGSSSQGRPDLGQRIIETWARLQDGETAVFAGLLKEDEQKNLQGIWGIADIPLIGKLFSSNTAQRTKTDVLLTIRAVIVRKPDIQPEDWEAFDPDLARTETGPFAPKPKAEATAKVGAVSEIKPTGKAEIKPAEVPTQPSTPKPEGDASKPKTEAAEATQEPEEGSLVLFLAPVFTPLAKGERVQLNLLVSNGKGLTSGTMDVRIDPKLKLVSVMAGDFLTGESGTLDQTPPKDGVLKLSFKRAGSASDSGTLATLEFEGVTPGNAPVLIQSGRYLVGANPISARVVNSLVTVE